MVFVQFCRVGLANLILWLKFVILLNLKNKKVLILAHRNILIEQHKKLIKNCRIASVFTEVNHLGENGMPDLIIIDEGTHKRLRKLSKSL